MINNINVTKIFYVMDVKMVNASELLKGVQWANVLEKLMGSLLVYG